MKILTFVLLACICFFYSCKQSDQSTPKIKATDSTAIRSKADTTPRAIATHPKELPVTELYARSRATCRVVVTKCSIVTDGSKAVIVMAKNNTGKKIDAIKIAWMVYNKAGKMIGNSAGLARKALSNGKSASYSWTINAPSGRSAKAFVYSIHYTNGSTWKVEGAL